MSTGHESNLSAPDETPPLVVPPVCTLGWSEQHPHAWVLIISVAVMLLSFWLRVDGDQQVVVPGLNVALPQTCMFRNMTALHCPGCGLTRSFISLANCQWQQAWQFNPIGWIIFILVAAQIPFRALQLLRLRSGRAALVFPGALWLGWTLMVLLLAQWVVRGVGRW